GITRKVGSEVRWTGEVRFVESALYLPLRWKKPRRIFVNSMSDLFHEKVKDEWIEQIFHVMLEADQHTYQILTKRPERMQKWVTQFLSPALLPSVLDHIWLGVSVEDQSTANERIPLLLETPAAVRWVSYEPALGPVDFYRWTLGDSLRRLSWIVCGGESGHGARPFDLAWARTTIEMGRAASIPVFMKQLGARPWWDGIGPPPPDHIFLSPGVELNGKVGWALDCLRDRKGGSEEDWPSDLRVREYPNA